MTGLVAITQRVDILEGRNERRDALDQRWAPFLAEAGLWPLILPNDPARAVALAERLAPSGLVLSGGNDLASHGGNAPERDETEKRLIEWARQGGRPIMAVCRGMQLLTHLMGGTLARIPGHVRNPHEVHGAEGQELVNSYHEWGVTVLPPGLEATAIAADTSIEAFRHRSERIEGIMWHPERDTPFRQSDIERFRRLFGDAK